MVTANGVQEHGKSCGHVQGAISLEPTTPLGPSLVPLATRFFLSEGAVFFCSDSPPPIQSPMAWPPAQALSSPVHTMWAQLSSPQQVHTCRPPSGISVQESLSKPPFSVWCWQGPGVPGI